MYGGSRRGGSFLPANRVAEALPQFGHLYRQSTSILVPPLVRRPKPQISNRDIQLLESPVTQRKQTSASHPNRDKNIVLKINFVPTAPLAIPLQATRTGPQAASNPLLIDTKMFRDRCNSIKTKTGGQL